MKCDYCGKEHNKGTAHPMYDVVLCNKCTTVVKPVMKVMFVNKKTGEKVGCSGKHVWPDEGGA